MAFSGEERTARTKQERRKRWEAFIFCLFVVGNEQKGEKEGEKKGPRNGMFLGWFGMFWDGFGWFWMILDDFG